MRHFLLGALTIIQPAKWPAGSGHIALVLLVASIFLGGCGRVSHSFPTLTAAKKDIAAGWIPPILPPSTRDLYDAHDLEERGGKGEFSFDPAEIDYLAKMGARPTTATEQEDADLDALQKQGFRLYRYTYDLSRWIIAVHPDGRGRYWLRDNKE